jgi:hypothetical protein
MTHVQLVLSHTFFHKIVVCAYLQIIFHPMTQNVMYAQLDAHVVPKLEFLIVLLMRIELLYLFNLIQISWLIYVIKQKDWWKLIILVFVLNLQYIIQLVVTVNVLIYTYLIIQIIFALVNLQSILLHIIYMIQMIVENVQIIVFVIQLDVLNVPYKLVEVLLYLN